MWLAPGRAEVRDAWLGPSASRCGFLSGDQCDSGRLSQLLVLLQVVIQNVELAVDLTYILLELSKFFLNDAFLFQLVLVIIVVIFFFIFGLGIGGLIIIEILDIILPFCSVFLLILTVRKHLVRVRIVIAPENLQLVAVVDIWRTRSGDLMNRGHFRLFLQMGRHLMGRDHLVNRSFCLRTFRDRFGCRFGLFDLATDLCLGQRAWPGKLFLGLYCLGRYGSIASGDG